ncbi:MAG: PKD domain-containing protein, partial [Bacteroidia bacterium]|nr:PKD domain-containing protein [Bacteroidia bacterium]
TWYLCFVDEAESDEGVLHDFSLFFGPTPPPYPQFTDPVCRMNNIGPCQCPDGSQECDLLPDMTNGASTIIQDHRINYDVPEIRVTTSTPNIGYGPLEVRGIGECYCGDSSVSCATPICPDGSYPKELIVQRVYRKIGNALMHYDRPAGVMTFHPTHSHMHVDHWVDNTIRLRGPNPDPRTWPIVGTGSKVSFCLINLSDCDASWGACVNAAGDTLHQADLPNRGLGQITGCGREQGIYVGKVDIYSYAYDGQQVNLSGLCNGDYYLVSWTDPNDNFLESDEDNNAVAVPFHFNQLPLGNCCRALFESNVRDGYVPFSVEFYDRSEPIPTSWHWDFGDGTTSDEQFPVHTYQIPGIYTVTLTISTSTGCTTEYIYPDYIVAGFDTVCTAQFSATNSQGTVPLTVQFTDQSHGAGQIVSWFWDFGDGATSHEQNPSHTYTAPGEYTVALVVVSEYNCRDTTTLTTAVNVTGWDTTCRAAFGASPTQGMAPLLVNFLDSSESIGTVVSWTWEFGDGLGTSVRHPQHLYDAPGVYTVRLIITNEYGCIDTSETQIRVDAPPLECQAEFTASVRTGTAPLQVSFSAASTPPAVSWFWDFGDGETSNENAPSHLYENPGAYTVALIVRTENGCVDTVRHADYIIVLPSENSRYFVRNAQIGLNAFPNPFPGAATIEYSTFKPATISCQVFDATGRLVKTFVANKTHMPGKHRFEFHAPCSGAYLVRLTVDGEPYHLKIVATGR